MISENLSFRKSLLAAVAGIQACFMTACASDVNPALNFKSETKYMVRVDPVSGNEDVYLLSCSTVRSVRENGAFSSNTTRLPGMPLRAGEWGESSYILPGHPGKKVLDYANFGGVAVTFVHPSEGIHRKARIRKIGDGLTLDLIWVEGPENPMRIVSTLAVEPEKDVLLGGRGEGELTP